MLKVAGLATAAAFRRAEEPADATSGATPTPGQATQASTPTTSSAMPTATAATSDSVRFLRDVCDSEQHSLWVDVREQMSKYENRTILYLVRRIRTFLPFHLTCTTLRAKRALVIFYPSVYHQSGCGNCGRVTVHLPQPP